MLKHAVFEYALQLLLSATVLELKKIMKEWQVSRRDACHFAAARRKEVFFAEGMR